jgi:hypothetical protein
MDLNPPALLPSACIPHIPYTDLNEILKIYGDADLTVSVSNVIVADGGFSSASEGIVGA